MRILLLNPPSFPRVLRDMSCGETVKASYYWAPIDLLVLSARVPDGADAAVLDATAERLGPSEAMERACSHEPDIVVSLVSAVSLDRDAPFLEELVRRTGAALAVIGDVPSFAPELMTCMDFVEAVIPDFTEEGIDPFLAGDAENATGLYLRGEDRTCSRTAPPGLSYGIPRHDLFPMKRYSMPYSVHRPVATMMLSYGCPYSCSFCASGKLRYRQRELEDFLAEYDSVASMGIREFFLRDLTFGVDRRRAEEFCRALAARDRMIWSCEARLDTVDPGMLELMRSAGCRLVMLGVETPDTDTLSLTSKGYGKTGRPEEIFRAARKAGIATLAHFIIGFPNDTRESIERLISFASALECDYASFNVMVPRLGSDLREELSSSGSVDREDLSSLDCSRGGMSLCGLTAGQLDELRRKALRRFYGRPSRLLRIAGRSMTPAGMANLVRNAARLLGRRKGS